MTLKQDIETTVREECYRGGFDNLPTVKEIDRKPHFDMHTCLRTREIAVNYNPEYEKKNPDKTKKIARDGTRHEINHHKYRGFNGCPRTLKKHDNLVYNPIAETLIPKGYSPEDVHYVSNALEDTILHTDLSDGFSLEGINYFFEDVGDCNGKFTPFYHAHVMLNLFLWGNKKQKTNLKRFNQYNPEVREVLKNFFEKTGISKIKHEYGKDREKIRDFLNDEINWPEISRVYAEEFSKLMKPNYAMPLLNHSGKGTKGKEDEDSSGEGNEFDREMKSKKFKRGKIRKTYESGKEAPIWMKKFESLDLLYESLAQELVVKSEVFTKQFETPVFWYGKRYFDPKTDSFNHLGFGFSETGKPELKKKKWHIDIPLEVKLSEKGFPEARFCLLDTSGSMQEGFSGNSDIGSTLTIPWGDKSKYHGSLVEFYGFIEFLKQNHLLNQSSISLANFSSRTNIGKGLLEAKKTALTPQFGSTKLDLGQVRQMFEGRNNLIFTISDGYIDNWNSIKGEFLGQARKHVYFHLQLGDENKVTEELEEKGFHAEYVRTPEELRGRTVNLTDKLLRAKKQSQK